MCRTFFLSAFENFGEREKGFEGSVCFKFYIERCSKLSKMRFFLFEIVLGEM